MNIVVITTLWRRPEIAGLMLARLQKQGMCVVAAGSEGETSRRLAEDHGAHYIEWENKPLGAKWNAALRAAKAFDPDGVVVLGSDNFVSSSLFSAWERGLATGIEYMGLIDGWMYMPADEKFVYWPGYVGLRRNEPLGSSRCYSRELLDRVDWHLWEDHLDRNLDDSVTRFLRGMSICPYAFVGLDKGIFHLGVKTSINMSPLPRDVLPRDPDMLGALFGEDLARALRCLP